MDKAGHPYILRPLRLMMRVETETEKIVAVLHEVVEGSQPPQRWGFDELRREGFSEPVLAAVECVIPNTVENRHLPKSENRRKSRNAPIRIVQSSTEFGMTRREGESYEEFIRRSLTHPVARRVKLADLKDNLDIRRLATLTDRDAERLRHYLAAWRVLTGAE